MMTSNTNTFEILFILILKGLITLLVPSRLVTYHFAINDVLLSP